MQENKKGKKCGKLILKAKTNDLIAHQGMISLMPNADEISEPGGFPGTLRRKLC